MTEIKTPLTDAKVLFEIKQRGGKNEAVCLNIVPADFARRLERDRARLVAVMREIARPALGGKAQQYAAQAILRELEEGQ